VWQTRILVEYARNVAGITDAQHAEYDPPAGSLLITPVACPVPERAAGAPALSGTLTVRLLPDSLIGRVLGQSVIAEAYSCSYELNPDFQDALVAHGLRITAVDDTGAVRAVELPDRRFFVATLFQPQRASREGRPHALIAAFIEAAAHRPITAGS
jgi:CTP synthase (UTP-ammonia lyase)